MQVFITELEKLAFGHPDLGWFAPHMRDLTRLDIPAATLPATTQLPTMAKLACPQTQAATDAFVAAAHQMRWQQSYTIDDPGIDQYHLDNYGWVNLISPAGHYANDMARISVGYWGRGVHYPDHAHEPEEWYLILAGSCRIWSDGRGTRECNPGDVIHHTPWQRHSADMVPGPLLAAAFWRGDGLLAKSKLDGWT